MVIQEAPTGSISLCSEPSTSLFNTVFFATPLRENSSLLLSWSGSKGTVVTVGVKRREKSPLNRPFCYSMCLETARKLLTLPNEGNELKFLHPSALSSLLTLLPLLHQPQCLLVGTLHSLCIGMLRTKLFLPNSPRLLEKWQCFLISFLSLIQ